MDLDGGIRDARADLRRKELRLRRRQRVVASLVLEPGGPVHEGSRSFDLRGHVRDHEGDALEGADRPAELLPRLGVRNRRIEGGLRQADGKRANADAAAIKDL